MEQKTIRIKFLDFWKGFDPVRNNFLLYRLLKKRYNVIICDDADYVFFSYSGEKHWGVPDKCVKIFYTGENLAPDFSACDYAIGFEHLSYEDRYIRFPLWLFYRKSLLSGMVNKHILPSDWDLKKDKQDFCSFVVSNPRGEERNEAFRLLSQYKKVDSGGAYMNNLPDGIVQDKLAFDSKHKFSLCYENSRHNGYTTEKIIQAFAARTVPIYWGDPLITDTFNKEAFIDVSSFRSFNEVIDEVIRLDSDDDAYLQKLLSPALLSTSPTIEDEFKHLEEWLYAIFDKPIEECYRRNRVMIGREYIDKHILWNWKVHRKDAYSILRRRYTRKLNNRYKKISNKIKRFFHIEPSNESYR